MKVGAPTALVRMTPNPQACPRLVCLPHAGGSPSVYRDWAEHLPMVELYAACYPGRAHRIEEPLPTDVREVAAELADAMKAFGDRPVALFGHSMGASVALETARLLEAEGVPVSHLFASGSRDGDSVAAASAPAAEHDPDAVIAELVRLGGTDAELAEDPVFRELVLPYVIADSRMFQTYVIEDEPCLSCPVTTIVGDADAHADVRPWRRLSVGGLEERVVAGDHFYLHARPPYDVLREAFATYSATYSDRG